MKRALPLVVCLCMAFMGMCQVQVSNFSQQTAGQIDPMGYIDFNNLLIFEGSEDGYGREIFSSDGTTVNTAILQDANPGSGWGQSVENFITAKAVLNGELFFIATDGTTAGELWKTDGTTAGTVQVTTALDRAITQLTTVGNELFFVFEKNDNTLEVYKSDGTEAGTVLVKENLPRWNHVSYQGEYNGYFMFVFQDYGNNYSRLWRSDGTDAGTFVISGDLEGNGISAGTVELSQFVTYNGLLYFGTRYSLYVTDGTAANTQSVAPMWQAGVNIANFGDAVVVNNKMYFSFYMKNLNRQQIWESDGTASGTQLVYDHTSSGFFYPSKLIVEGNTLLFLTGKSSTGNTELVSFDVTNYQTTSIHEFTEALNDTNWDHWHGWARFFKVSNTEYFISTPYGNFGFLRYGYWYDMNANMVTLLNGVENVLFATGYNDQLFFSNYGQLWKYDTTLGVSPVVEDVSLQIYPNPVAGTLSYATEKEIKNIMIYDVQGRAVLAYTPNGTKEIKLDALLDGIYVMEFYFNNGHTTTRRFVKE